jgi:hypothetical protein
LVQKGRNEASTCIHIYEAAETAQIDAEIGEAKLLRVLLVVQNKQPKLRRVVKEGTNEAFACNI